MRLGLYVPVFDELADPALVARLCAEAEEAGWDGVFVRDQVRWREPVVAVADPQITLAAIDRPMRGIVGGSCIVAVQEAKAYPRAMPSGLSSAIDSRLEDLIVAWARRRWPPLRLVPARWIRPAVAPMASRLRRLLARAVLAAAPIGVILGLVILKL